MPTVKPPKSKKVDVEKNQIDFISGADRDPLEWDQYDHEKRMSNAIRLTERENKMTEEGRKKLGKQMGVTLSKQAYLLIALREQLKKDLKVDPNDID